MTSTESITIIVSIIALVVSIVAIGLQYFARSDCRFKISDLTLTSLAPEEPAPRTAVIAFGFSAYNLGNRPAVLEHVSLHLTAGDFDALLANRPTTCEKHAYGQPLVPISKRTYSQLSIPPMVISAQNILSEEFVFDLFFFARDSPAVAASGLLCLEVRFSNHNGIVKSIMEPIGLVDISLRRPDMLDIKFQTDVFPKPQSLMRVF